ncbi:MAG: type II toxin-antitoxin system VapC family toxin [Deltaproteobacteria bacterium]|nr:type II toxin-antitoxin system VapC family toxin [Deltaproteobacteria bacterium]
MIAYLDTSSLVKLYIEEDSSSEVAALVDKSEITATSLIAYAEARAAFARRFREGAFTDNEYKILKDFFDQDWNRYLVVNLTEENILFAGELAEKHALRGFDAIHLASALRLRSKLSSSVAFSCFDKHLSNAARLEDLEQG